jgi:hypothetical protein
MTRKLICLSFFLAAFCAQFAASQSKRDGAINGRIHRDDGRPAAGVEVSIRRISESRGSERATTSDEEGSFRFTNLAPAVYVIQAEVPGYIVDGASLGSNVYRAGEQATIRLTKGGVITGRVTGETGEPVVRLAVTAIRLRGVEAQSTGSSTSGSPAGMLDQGTKELGFTDDRGVYRIYGLPPGVYIVGIGDTVAGAIDSPELGRDAPTYYPSAPRDTAEEITLRGAEEVSGIDIRHRGEQGRAISGVISAAGGSARQFEFAIVRLRGAEANEFETLTYIHNSRGFVFYCVADGEYELQAWGGGDKDDAGAGSAPRRISVKGADLSGIELKLSNFALLAGRVIIESAAKKCEIPTAVPATAPEARKSFVEEITLRALHAEVKPGATNQYLWPRESRYGIAPNSKGAFTLRGLGAGRYFLAANLPDDNWYVRAITVPTSASASSQRAASTAKKPAESGSSGITVKSGEKLSAIELKVSEGAAALRGKIVPAAATDKLPGRMRIHLIPAEVSTANDVLRYAEMITGADGMFGFNHIAPGKYWLLTKPAVEKDHERPAAWDPIERAKLRRDAASGKNEIELQPCQRVKNLEVRFIP